MASEVSALNEAQMTSQASGFHHLDLSSNSPAEIDPRLNSWFEQHDNRECLECGALVELKDAWASVTLAASLCQFCAGYHRALGSHLFAVKSLTLDAWSSKDIDCLRAGGNQRLRAALGRPKQRALPVHSDEMVQWLRSVYSSKEARLYRQRLYREAAPITPGLRAARGSAEQAEAAAGAAEARAHADALTRRPGYFRTTQGFGYAGPDAKLSLADVEVEDKTSVVQCCLAMPGDLLQAVAGTFGIGCWTVPREPPSSEVAVPRKPPSLVVVGIAEEAGPREPSIFECAERGDAREVERLVLSGCASVDDVDALGWTPLFYASKFGRDEVCKLLLRMAEAPRALANARELGGMRWAPLHYAAEMGHSGCAYLLLRAGAAPDGPEASPSSRTPLRVAAFNRHSETVDVLLGFGADPALLQDKLQFRADVLFVDLGAERVAACAAHFAWLKTRSAFLLRDKAQVSSGPEYALVKLLHKPVVFASVVKFL